MAEGLHFSALFEPVMCNFIEPVMCNFIEPVMFAHCTLHIDVIDGHWPMGDQNAVRMLKYMAVASVPVSGLNMLLLEYRYR